MTTLGKCMGIGSSCEVYEWGGDDKVVKLFHANIPLEAVQLEFRNCSAAWESRLPAARPFELLVWEGRNGIIFENVMGETFLKRIFEQLYSYQEIDFFEANSDLRKFARVLNEIHTADVAEVCIMFEYAVLPPDTPSAVIEFFEVSRKIAYNIFIDEYCNLSGVTEEDIRAWYVPAAARSIASEALPGEQVANLVAMIRDRLSIT